MSFEPSSKNLKGGYVASDKVGNKYFSMEKKAYNISWMGSSWAGL